MAPPNIPSPDAVSKADASPPPPPPVPVKAQSRRPGTAKSIRTLSNSSIPTLASTRLARQPSTSSSSNATLVQQSPLPARRPVRSSVCPSSSRAPLPHPVLDPSQDHHRSDSGRSTGSSRSTATTDSFFLPQHPHVLNRRFKDLPAPPSSSALAEAARSKTSDASPHGLSIALGSSAAAASASLPVTQLYRSQSSVSTTPTSPEEGDGSPLGGPVPSDFPLLDDDEPIERKTNKVKSDDVDALDEFWQSDYSYARPSLDLARTSLPPLMRSNAPIPPSRSQSLDPFAAPLDMPTAADGAYKTSDDDHTLQEQSPPVGSVTPLVTANLQKLNSQHTSSPRGAPTLSSPVLSSLSGAPTPTKRSGDDRLAVPRISSYKPPLTSTSSDSSGIDHRSHPNKSSSSLSTSSAHENEKTALATPSKRSSTSSSSSFRMTLSRQAKTLRNSFMWTPPVNAQSQLKGQERVVTAGSSNPSLALPATSSPPAETPVVVASGSVARAQQAKPASANKTSKPTSSRSSQSSVDLHSKQSVPKIRRSDAKVDSSAPGPSTVHSVKPKPPTDYAKLDERPRSRLSSRLTLQNTTWSKKISNLKQKKPDDVATSTSVAPATTTSEASSRAPSRRSKSQASLSSAGTVVPGGTVRANARDAGKRSSVVQVSERPGPLAIVSTPLLTSGRSSAEPQLSPSFAQTFAFLQSQIDSQSQSPPLLATALPPLKEAQISVLNAGEAVRLPDIAAADPVKQEKRADELSTTDLVGDAVSGPTSHSTQSQVVDGEDAEAQAALFQRLADSPEAVYKTLVLPESKILPASQSLDSVAATSSSASNKLGHKKHISLGSANLISRSARRAAADLDRRANAAPVVNGHVSTKSSFSGALPLFTPVDEENNFFDALTSPLNEHLSHAAASASPDDSVLPTFATATEFFPLTATEPTSPVRDRPPASQSTASIAAMAPSATQVLPQPNRSSLGRRLSGVFDTSKARSVRRNLVASPPQSPRTESAPMDALPARAETSLGFYLRNPLRRERKASLKTAAPQPTLSQSRTEIFNTTSSSKSPASAIRKMSSGFKFDRSAPADRAETSLGLAPPGIKARQGFSSSVLAPTKSSLARSVQPSPPSASSAGRSTVRSTSTSSLGASASTTSHSRSPQRPANPPSSFRRSPAASSRHAVSANESPTRGSTVSPSALARTPLSMAKAFTPSQQNGSASAATSQAVEDAELATMPGPSDVRRRRTMSKPVLQPIRTSFAEEPRIARPSTAMGFRGGMTTKDRKMSQPTLDMVDDHEFLAALEQVRAVHRERIEARAQEVENKTRLARLGMMSGNYLKTKVSGTMLDDDDLVKPSEEASLTTAAAPKAVQEEGSAASAIPVTAAKARLRHRRSASADSKLGSTQSLSPAHEVDQRQKDIVKAYADKKSPIGAPTSGLEWGVGKASGKLHDGTFVNDDDWKKEVKALFLIRELVQTERSYARHLSSLFAVVVKMPGVGSGSSSAPGIKRKSTSNLFAAYSSAYTSKTSAQAVPPGHIGLLRTYLPQLIALSNSLVQRVEENPTSAGVGAAFDVLSAQLESTFVGWSSVASEALKEMRSTELAKAKSPYKIGLVPLMPRESTEVGASTAGEASSSSGNSSPASGLRQSTLRMTSLTRPTSPVGARAEVENSVQASPADGATLPVKRSTKRRSTITSTSFIAPPRIVVAPAAKVASSPEQEKGAAETVATTPSRRFGHSRSQSTFVTPTSTPTSVIAPDGWSGLSMTPSAAAAVVPNPSASASGQAQQRGGKSLTPMDIAIMPTQRIPRYGLMLRDLLRNTPPESLSHARVQRAISLIQKVALLCDSAAPVPTVGGSTAPSSGAATPAGSVLGMTSADSLGGAQVQVSPMLSASAFGLGKRG